MITGTRTISSYQDQDLRVNLTCLCHTNPFIILLRLLHRGVKVGRVAGVWFASKNLTPRWIH